MAIYGQEHNNMCFYLKKESDRDTQVVGIKGYLYGMNFDMGKTEGVTKRAEPIQLSVDAISLLAFRP